MSLAQFLASVLERDYAYSCVDAWSAVLNHIEKTDCLTEAEFLRPVADYNIEHVQFHLRSILTACGLESGGKE